MDDNPTKSPRSVRRFGAARASLLGVALLAAACGGSDTAAPAAQEPAAEAAAPTTAPTTLAVPAATIGATELGDVLVGELGLTLYGFTNDIDASSVCYGACADAWPPVIVDADWSVAPGLDEGIFNATVRDDGQLQLVAGKWPLYYFAGDATAGDVNGQGSGDVWFAVGTDGLLIEGAAESESASEEPVAEAAVSVTTGETDLGPVLVDEGGLTLYGFTNDVDGLPTCSDACADAWPPYLVDGDGLPAGLDEAVFSVATRDDGSSQLVAGKWPLYYFAGDAAPGDVNGQGSGDVWFVVTADGGLVGAPSESASEEPVAEAAVSVTTGETDLGPVLVDEGGLTLYGFTNDVDGLPTCNDACADAWPPYLVDGDGLPAGLDDAVFSVAVRDDGSSQLVAGKWPLYYFAGDAAPGDVNGQGSGDVWFVVTADGGLVGADASAATGSGY